MGEREQMLGRLTILEQEAHKLKMRFDSLCRAIRAEINPALKEVEDMDIASAAQQMDDLVMTQSELLSIGSKISRLKMELGLG